MTAVLEWINTLVYDLYFQLGFISALLGHATGEKSDLLPATRRLMQIKGAVTWVLLAAFVFTTRGCQIAHTGPLIEVISFLSECFVLLQVSFTTNCQNAKCFFPSILLNMQS